MMHWIHDKLKTFGKKIACFEAGRFWSYTDFLNLIDQAAANLPDAKKQLIEITSEMTLEGLARLIAIAQRGHIALPLPPDLPTEERERMRAVAAESPLYDQLEGSGLVLFSSGTSGRPKGMLHNLDMLLSRYRGLKARQDRCLLLLRIDHIGGLDTALRCLLSGSTLVIPERRTPEAAGASIAQHRVNVLPASPTFLNLMLLAQIPETHDLSSVEIVAYGSEAMPQNLLQRLVKAFPQAQLQQKFGTSETGTVRIQSAGNESLFFYIDDRDTKWKIIEDELWLKTPSRILGYLNADKKNLEADGWYRTGDLVETNDEGQLRIIGRASALINVGGQKVHPSEVEAILSEIEGIEACKVYGKADPITGNIVACDIVVCEEKDLRAWKRAIRSYARGKLATWKVPSKVTVVDGIGVDRRMKLR